MSKIWNVDVGYLSTPAPFCRLCEFREPICWYITTAEDYAYPVPYAHSARFIVCNYHFTQMIGLERYG